jgi:glutaredoxin
MTARGESLQEYLTQNKIVVFGVPGCRDCVRIEKWLSTMLTDANDFSKIDVSTLEDPDPLIEELRTTTGATVFPFCFYDGAYETMETLKSLVYERTSASIAVNDDF